MNALNLIENLEWLRSNIIGRNRMFTSPFGERPIVYADYTASGRAVFFIENYINHLYEYYANTHTEDDFTGKTMTTLLHEAEKEIKRLVNAGPCGKIIFSGTGATGGISRLQQILGVYWSPATKMRVKNFLGNCKQRSIQQNCHSELLKYIEANEPVVFVGPYEHHSNEIMWRQTLCEVVEIPLNKEGFLNLEELEKAVSDPQYTNRQKIGSFSAASNVSGIKTPVYDIARILHKYGAIACFDFAACGPYVEINMNRDDESYFDAIFMSPHKFLGGPGSSGILIFNEKIYPKQLPPSIAAGGTVSYVSMEDEAYLEDIEEREKPGTPGIIQAIKVALAFKLKEKVGVDTIDEIENYYLRKFYEAFADNDKIIFYGTKDPEKKINIIPFNIGHNDRIFHPKYITKLLNDLFGIQTRAGCSCAGPYGHRLLNINNTVSRKYRHLITDHNLSGMKPGWVRLNMHYSLSLEEFNYIIEAVRFVSRHAEKFLTLYHMNFQTGEWNHVKETNNRVVDLNFDRLLSLPPFTLKDCGNCQQIFDKVTEELNEELSHLTSIDEFQKFPDEVEELMFFYVRNSNFYQECNDKKTCCQN